MGLLVPPLAESWCCLATPNQSAGWQVKKRRRRSIPKPGVARSAPSVKRRTREQNPERVQHKCAWKKWFVFNEWFWHNHKLSVLNPLRGSLEWDHSIPRVPKRTAPWALEFYPFGVFSFLVPSQCDGTRFYWPLSRVLPLRCPEKNLGHAQLFRMGNEKLFSIFPGFSPF